MIVAVALVRWAAARYKDPENSEAGMAKTTLGVIEYWR